MKTLGKKSVSSFLKAVVTVAWYAQLIAAAMLILAIVLSVLGLIPDSVQDHVVISNSKDIETQVIISNDNVSNIADHATLRSALANEGGMFLILSGTLVFLILSLYITFLLKKILNSLSEGIPFTMENSKRIRLISYAIMVLSPLGFIFNLLTDNIGQSKSFSVSLSFSDLATLFLGLIIFIIAEIFKEGYRMQEEQKLIV